MVGRKEDLPGGDAHDGGLTLGDMGQGVAHDVDAGAVEEPRLILCDGGGA